MGHKLVPSCSREGTREQQRKLNSKTGKLSETTPRWFPGSDKTSRRRARLGSISRSTWSSTPATSTCPCPPTLTGMTSPTPDSPPSSEADQVPEQERWQGRLPGHRQAKYHRVGHPRGALEAALELEKTVNQSLLDMHKASDGDAHLCDFLEGEFLDEQVDAIKE